MQFTKSSMYFMRISSFSSKVFSFMCRRIGSFGEGGLPRIKVDLKDFLRERDIYRPAPFKDSTVDNTRPTLRKACQAVMHIKYINIFSCILYKRIISSYIVSCGYVYA